MPVPNSNRSSSPISSKTHSSSRNSDPNSTTRRSFSGNPSHKPSVLLTNPRNLNPTTPANSPSGFGRRISAGYGGTDEKENDQSIKPVKSRPSATGSKNFMAPTISAACKLTPSPRKKVLEERNELVRTSISLSEGKVTSFSSTDEAEGGVPKYFQKSVEAHMESIANDSEQKKADLERPFVDKAMKRVRFADSTLDSGNSTESVLLHSDMSAKNESSSDSVSRIIAPLDADPSFLPYDPKTNYLSPRPQFLHYKPNPRISVLINKEKGMDDEGVKRLEDNFTSFESNSSDTTDSTEEMLSSDDSQRDSEASSAEIDEPPKAEEEDIHGSESLISGDKNVYEKSVMVAEGKGKRGLVRRLRFIFMLVGLLISCYSISVTYSPGTADSTILKALNISQLNLNQPAAVVDLAKANFNLFSHRFKKFSIETMSHLSLPIINTGQGGGQLSPLQFMNLTEVQNDILVGGYLNEGSQKSPEWDDLEEESRVWDDLEQENRDCDLEEEKIVESFEETFGKYVSDSSTEHEPAIENDLLLIGALPPVTIPTGLASETICDQEEAAPRLDTESQDFVNPEHFAASALEVHKEDNFEGNVVNLDSNDNVEPLQDYVQPEHYVAISPPVHEVSIDNTPENLEGSLNLESNANEECLSEDINIDTLSDAIHPPIVELPSDMGPYTLGDSRTKTSDYQLTGSATLVLAVLSISFAAFISRKRGSGSRRNLRVDTNELLSKKTVLATSSAMEQLYQEKSSSPNLPTVDDVLESCSSEMSSYQSHNNNNRLRSANEAQSGERRPRKYSKRESFSSSDFSFGGSPSYGSFTTYERIPIKNATGDDEVVTPVRRSSRLRSHVTS